MIFVIVRPKEVVRAAVCRGGCNLIKKYNAILRAFFWYDNDVQRS